MNQTRSAFQLRAYIKREDATQFRYALKQLTGALQRGNSQGLPRRRSVLGRGSGRVIFGLANKREQQSVVKMSYTKNTATRSWAAHGKYLQREHAQQEDQKGLGFNGSARDIDIRDMLQTWQEANDPHFFKLILSPGNGHRLDLPQHVRELMEIAECDLGTRLEWVAIDHHNTDHPHVHVLIRGVDAQGEPLIIDPTYIAEGFRKRSQQLATNLLGLRTQREISLSRGRQIDKQRVTDIDRSLRYKAVGEVVSYASPVPNNALARERRLQEIKRLKFLETLGLADPIAPKQWRLNPKLETTLKALQLSGDIIKSRAQHGYGVVDLNEHLSPTDISPDRPITGRVIGMGLEDELYDKRYLLLEGSDGKVHYLRATNSIVKARDTRQFQNGDVITLAYRTFISPSRDEAVIELPKNYIAVTNHHSLEQLIQAPVSPLDEDVMRYVQTFGYAPGRIEANPNNRFGEAYAQAMQARFVELKAVGLFVEVHGHIQPVANWQEALIDVQHHRLAPQFERWQPELNADKPDKPLLGEVVASSESKFLLKDVRGSYHQILRQDLGLSQAPIVGRVYYIRSNRPPGLEFTGTDERLVKYCARGYKPENQRAQLRHEQSQKENFFLETKENVDSFVSAHQRRADTWVKWGLLEQREGIYYVAPSVEDGALAQAMKAKLQELKADTLKQPGLCTVITDAKLAGDSHRFTLIDKLVGEIGKPSEPQQSPMANRLAAQVDQWERRGLTMDNEFEKNARRWITKASKLAVLEKEIKAPIQRPDHSQIKRYEGTVVTMGSYDEAQKPYVVIKDKQGYYYAFPADHPAFNQAKLKMTLVVDYQQTAPVTKQKKHQAKSQNEERTIKRDSLEE